MIVWRRLALALAAAAFAISFLGTLTGVIPRHDAATYSYEGHR